MLTCVLSYIVYIAGMRRKLKQYKGSCANCKYPKNHPIPKTTQEQPSEHRTAAQNVRKGEMKKLQLYERHA